MKVPYLSASRLKMATDCSLYYEYHYDAPSKEIAAVKRKAQHPAGMQAALLGTCVHNALEEWRRPDPKTGKTPKPKWPRLKALYEEMATKDPLTPEMYQDGINMLRRWFDRRGSDPVRVVAVEQAIGQHRAPYRFKRHGTPVFGFVDLIIEHKSGVIELIDYKTQRAPMTQAEADSNIQAGIYLLYARERWPDREIIFTFDLTRYGCVTTTKTDVELDVFEDWLESQYKWLSGLEKGVATLGDSCKYCPFADYCPVAHELIDDDLWDVVGGAEWQSDDEMLEQLEKIKAAQGLLNRQRKKIENRVKQEIFNPGMMPDDCQMETEQFKVSWTSSERREYLPSELQRVMPPRVFTQVVKVNNTALDTARQILPDDVVKEIEESAVVKFGRRLNIRRKKK